MNMAILLHIYACTSSLIRLQRIRLSTNVYMCGSAFCRLCTPPKTRVYVHINSFIVNLFQCDYCIKWLYRIIYFHRNSISYFQHLLSILFVAHSRIFSCAHLSVGCDFLTFSSFASHSHSLFISTLSHLFISIYYFHIEVWLVIWSLSRYENTNFPVWFLVCYYIAVWVWRLTTIDYQKQIEENVFDSVAS